MLLKGCGYVAQSVQTECYVDTVAKKLIKTVSRQKFTMMKNGRQQNGVRQRKLRKIVPRQERGEAEVWFF
jgi:hypothetical protein